MAEQILGITELEEAMNQIAVNLPVSYERRQKLLEAVKLSDKYELLGEMLANEVHVMQIKTALGEKFKAHIDQNQKEYILREQLKVIRQELGEDTTDSDIDKFERQLRSFWATILPKDRWFAAILRLFCPCRGRYCLRIQSASGEPSEFSKEIITVWRK